MEEYKELKFMKFDEDAGKHIIELSCQIYPKENHLTVFFGTEGTYQPVSGNLSKDDLKQLGEWLINQSK